MVKLGRINAVREVFRADCRRVSRILLLESGSTPRLRELAELARARQIPLHTASKKQLDRICPGHQGVVAFVSPKGFMTMESILRQADVPFLLILDGVEDPRNLGALIRTAEGAGVDGIILPERRAAGLTPAVSAASAGAVEHMPIARVKNLARAVEYLKKSGLWLVGAEVEGDGSWDDFDYTGPVGLVLGSEGKGLRPLVRRSCDAILSLPLFGAMTSLNVSAAGAVFMYEVVRQRKLRGKQPRDL